MDKKRRSTACSSRTQFSIIANQRMKAQAQAQVAMTKAQLAQAAMTMALAWARDQPVQDPFLDPARAQEVTIGERAYSLFFLLFFKVPLAALYCALHCNKCYYVASQDKGNSLPNADQLFKNKFCFYQTESGKIPEVSHPEYDTADVINIKKSIAAAFQTNFKKTEEAVEEDPQSLHISHYK